MKRVLPVVIILCILGGFLTIIILASEKFRCNTSGIVNSMEITTHHNRISVGSSLSYEYTYEVNKTYKRGGSLINEIVERGWGPEQWAFANEWLKKHPVGSAVDVNYHCLLPNLSYIGNQDTRTWSGFIYSTFFWGIFLILGIVSMFTGLYLVSKMLFKKLTSRH